MNKAPVLPTRPALLFKDKQPKDDQVPTLHTTKTRRSSYSNSTADRALVAAAAAAPTAVLQRPKLCSTEAAHGKLWAVCYVWHYTTTPTTATATTKPLPPFKSHFEVCYGSADRSLTRKSMQRNESKGPAAHFQDKQNVANARLLTAMKPISPLFENNLL